jgi:hypothetical protein
MNKVSLREAPDYYDGTPWCVFNKLSSTVIDSNEVFYSTLCIFLVVKNPMDFGQMRKKLNSHVYKSKVEFMSDLQLIYSNCVLYNSHPQSVFRHYAEFLTEKTNSLGKTIPDITVRKSTENDVPAASVTPTLTAAPSESSVNDISVHANGSQGTSSVCSPISVFFANSKCQHAYVTYIEEHIRF